MAPSTVLLIDSDSDSIEIYSLILRYHGYEVVPAMDGRTGLNLALELGPDLVISELFLPAIEGRTLLESLRSHARTARTPVIILDSIPGIGDTLVDPTALSTRLIKPCEPSRLLKEVGRVLHGGHSRT